MGKHSASLPTPAEAVKGLLDHLQDLKNVARAGCSLAEQDLSPMAPQRVPQRLAEWLADADRALPRWLQAVRSACNIVPEGSGPLDRAFRLTYQAKAMIEGAGRLQPEGTSEADRCQHVNRLRALSRKLWGLVEAVDVETLRGEIDLALSWGGRPAVEEKTQSRAAVNARILETMQKEPLSIHWSQRQWAERLGCSPSAVAEALAWKTVMAARATEAGGAIERHQDRNRDRRRRPRHD